MHTVMNVACLSVDICICLPHTYLRNHTSNSSQISFVFYLWPWPGLPLFDGIAIPYVLSGVDDSCPVCSCTPWPWTGDSRRAYRLHAQRFNTVAYTQTEGTALDRIGRNWCQRQKCNNIQSKSIFEQFALYQKWANLFLICTCFQLQGGGVCPPDQGLYLLTPLWRLCPQTPVIGSQVAMH